MAEHNLLRHQNDGRFLEYSLKSAISFPEEENKTRAEFRADSDINSLMARYGAIPPAQRQAQYGIANFDDDLTTAYAAIDNAREVYNALPPEVKKLYPSWEQLAQEIARGDANPALGQELKARLEELEKAEREERWAQTRNVPPQEELRSDEGGTRQPKGGRTDKKSETAV